MIVLMMIGSKMSENKHDKWNSDGSLPEMKRCPFCGGTARLCDNGYWQDSIWDLETSSYKDSYFCEADFMWCKCQKCGATSEVEETPALAIADWNRRFMPPREKTDVKDDLKTKFIVYRAYTGERVNDCFVLRPEKDPAAVAAIRAYANATDNNVLRHDLLMWIGGHDETD